MLKHSPLHEIHQSLGARMVEFGGWLMPVRYSGVIDEHLAVRNTAGLFDVSHMGEIEVKGADALDFLQDLTVNDVSLLQNGQVQYTAMCYPHGGTVDDLTLYRFDHDHFLLCVNAANIDKDFAWIEQVRTDSGYTEVLCHNRSYEFAQLALQGPASEGILSRLTQTQLDKIAYYHFHEGLVADVPMIISRTGYTGEDGFELYLAPDQAEPVWQALLEAGKPDGLLPAGLGARDTLRLEAGLALYGHELSPEISPLEARLGWIVKLDKGDFIGRAALARIKNQGPPRRLIGLQMTEAGVPRAGYAIFHRDRRIGHVTSGTLSPSLREGIALALVEHAPLLPGTEVHVEIRGRRVAAKVVKPPFFRS
ncbi:MAG: glycine cleavage system aminomethyltransferase GcvT [Geoalkalibacter sp.]|uniref:glycine cleavage system aminomethyltransferase GcvT n=1 Tax=Geoalkalibacter sp. TaxID=3041440 RepID=UPI003D0D05E3